MVETHKDSKFSYPTAAGKMLILFTLSHPGQEVTTYKKNSKAKDFHSVIHPLQSSTGALPLLNSSPESLDCVEKV